MKSRPYTLYRYVRRRLWLWYSRITVCIAWSIFTALAILILLVAANFLVPITDGLVRKIYTWLPPSETTGLIIVDNPKVYTRERLVNDRLEEAGWLEHQLDLTADQLFQPQFRSVAGQLTTLKQEALSIATGAGVGKPPELTTKADGQPATSGQDSADKQYKSQILEPIIDRFHDLHTFREEVRAEMMQTQLDDRHDIDGNTVYRLTFDTTIIAGQNTRKLAWVGATISRETYDKEALDIFRDWQDKIEKDANRLLDSQLRAFL